MSYSSKPPGSFPMHTTPSVGAQFHYSSSSDGTGNSTSVTDYSTDTEYSSKASDSFDFGPAVYTHDIVDGAAVAGFPPAYAAPHYPPTPFNPGLQQQDLLYDAVSQQQQQQHHHHHHHHHHQQGRQQGVQQTTPMPPPNAQTIHPAPTPNISQAAAAAAAAAAASQQQQQQQYQRIARFVGPPPVALACTECRSRHLKCDAGVPSCSRCTADKRECSYVKSRRGWKGTRRKKVAAAAAAEREKQDPSSNSSGNSSGGNNTSSSMSGTDTDAGESGSMEAEGNPSVLMAGQGLTCHARPPVAPFRPSSSSPTVRQNAPPPPQPSPAVTAGTGSSPPSLASQTNPLETLRAHHKGSTLFPSQQELPGPAPPTANLMQLYYAYFHSAHPFCLPPAQLIKTPAQQLTVLLPVMRYTASFFAATAPTETFRRDAEAALFSPVHPPPRNAFTVQALLLFAIVLHSDNEQERSGQVKDIAVDMALALGMNLREFSESSGSSMGDAGKVLEESWRRTWWELYYLDGLLAGVHQRDSFRLWSMECSVPLPCEEIDYNTGRIPEPPSLQDFDDRHFATDPPAFSSFAYRVEAVRILGQVLAVGQTPDPEDPRADAADASLVNWGLHLPDEKKELVGKDRRIDEMLFQAHMVVNAATIFLHRPKSHLAISLVPDDTACTPPTKWSTSEKPIALHTAKAIAAANTISKLIILPTPLIKHTPFFTCVITLAAIVHLSACSWLLQGDEAFLAKERIRLSVGALKTLEEVWTVAGCVLGQVKSVAREVFRLPPPTGTSPDGTRASVISEEEVMRYIDEERTLEIVGGEADYHGLPALDWDGN